MAVENANSPYALALLRRVAGLSHKGQEGGLSRAAGPNSLPPGLPLSDAQAINPAAAWAIGEQPDRHAATLITAALVSGGRGVDNAKRKIAMLTVQIWAGHEGSAEERWTRVALSRAAENPASAARPALVGPFEPTDSPILAELVTASKRVILASLLICRRPRHGRRSDCRQKPDQRDRCRGPQGPAAQSRSVRSKKEMPSWKNSFYRNNSIVSRRPCRLRHSTSVNCVH